MGGYGSGPWVRSAYPAAESCRRLDVVSFRARSLLHPGILVRTAWGWRDDDGELEASVELELDLRPGAPSYLIRYTAGSERARSTPIELRGALLRTSPHYGGARWWWACPGCQRRARVLYLPPGSPVFACRRCHQLRHYSQAESRADRLLRKSRKLYHRAGSEDGGTTFIYKPKGLHWRTFDRLVDKAEAATLASMRAHPFINRLIARLEAGR